MVKGLPLVIWAYNNAVAAKYLLPSALPLTTSAIDETVRRFGGVRV